MTAFLTKRNLFIKKAMILGLTLGIFSMATALELSVGGGGVFAASFNGGNTHIDQEYIINTWTGGGFNLFFDATYAEFGVGMFFGADVWTARMNDTLEEWRYDNMSSGAYTFTRLDISLYGKYPFSPAERITLFPMAGGEYQIELYGKFLNGSKVEYIDTPHRLWLKFGAGADYAITDRIYVRNVALYGIGFSSNAETLARKLFNEGESDTQVTFSLYHGLTVKIGVGYKF